MLRADGSLDLSELDASLAEAERRAKQLRPAFRELRKPMRLDQRDHAKAQQGPDGAWAPRSPLTEARRKARNRGRRTTAAMRTVMVGRFPRRPTPKKILGRLPGAVEVVAGGLFVRASSRAYPMGGANNRGARVGRRRRVLLRARTFLWLSDDLKKKAAEVLGEHVAKGFKR